MDGTTLTVAGILSAVAPLVIALLNQVNWSAGRKQIVALVVSVVLGAAALAVTGGFTSGQDVATIVLAVVGATQAAYALIWKPTGVAPLVERVTSRDQLDLAA